MILVQGCPTSNYQLSGNFCFADGYVPMIGGGSDSGQLTSAIATNITSLIFNGANSVPVYDIKLIPFINGVSFNGVFEIILQHSSSMTVYIYQLPLSRSYFGYTRQILYPYTPLSLFPTHQSNSIKLSFPVDEWSGAGAWLNVSLKDYGVSTVLNPDFAVLSPLSSTLASNGFVGLNGVGGSNGVPGCFSAFNQLLSLLQNPSLTASTGNLSSTFESNQKFVDSLNSNTTLTLLVSPASNSSSQLAKLAASAPPLTVASLLPPVTLLSVDNVPAGIAVLGVMVPFVLQEELVAVAEAAAPSTWGWSNVTIIDSTFRQTLLSCISSMPCLPPSSNPFNLPTPWTMQQPMLDVYLDSDSLWWFQSHTFTLSPLLLTLAQRVNIYLSRSVNGVSPITAHRAAMGGFDLPAFFSKHDVIQGLIPIIGGDLTSVTLQQLATFVNASSDSPSIPTLFNELSSMVSTSALLNPHLTFAEIIRATFSQLSTRIGSPDQSIILDSLVSIMAGQWSLKNHLLFIEGVSSNSDEFDCIEWLFTP